MGQPPAGLGAVNRNNARLPPPLQAARACPKKFCRIKLGAVAARQKIQERAAEIFQESRRQAGGKIKNRAGKGQPGGGKFFPLRRQKFQRQGGKRDEKIEKRASKGQPRRGKFFTLRRKKNQTSKKRPRAGQRSKTGQQRKIWPACGACLTSETHPTRSQQKIQKLILMDITNRWLKHKSD